MKTESLESFLGTQTSGIRLRAPNDTELDIERIVIFNFYIPCLNDSFEVAFNVTKQELETPILGFNMIEHFVEEYPDLEALNHVLNPYSLI